MLYDGYCASTCTLFSEWMRLQGGVKSIAMGGRPNKNPIQGIGGVKGAQDLGFGDVLFYAQLAADQTNDTELLATLSTLTELPIDRALVTSLNLRDNILPDNLNDGTPAQFIVEEADCRLFWTADHVKDITNLWKSAATAAWGGGKCVAGDGLQKREHVTSHKHKRTPVESKKDAIGRREALRRMEADLSNPTTKLKVKFGKKVIV
jgi:hypothetical protein